MKTQWSLAITRCKGMVAFIAEITKLLIPQATQVRLPEDYEVMKIHNVKLKVIGKKLMVNQHKMAQEMFFYFSVFFFHSRSLFCHW